LIVYSGLSDLSSIALVLDAKAEVGTVLPLLPDLQPLKQPKVAENLATLLKSLANICRSFTTAASDNPFIQLLLLVVLLQLIVHFNFLE
jgi:hypothetical protein